MVGPHPRRRGHVGEVAVIDVAERREPCLLPETDRAGGGAGEEDQVPLQASRRIWAVRVAGLVVGEDEAIQSVGADDGGLQMCQRLEA